MNKKEVKKAPALRFKGFTNDWEQRKLGEIAKTYSGGTPSISNKKFYINGHIPFIKSGEIGSTRTEQKINYDGLNNSSARLIETGTLLYALYGATSGKAAISPIDGAINQAVLAIIPQNNVNRFIYEWLNKNKSRITGKYLQGGQGNLSAKIIKQINIYITSKNEELKISNILRIVNKIISLQQRKLELLKASKKAVLQNIFTDTKRVPTIRFNTFSENWNQKRLKPFLIKYNKKTTVNNQYPVLTSSRQGLFFQKDYYDGNQIASKNNIGYNIVPRNYFTYRHMSDDLIFHFNINTICDYGIVSTLYPVFTTTSEIDSQWLLYYLNHSVDIKKYALLQKQGGSRTYMYFSKLESLKAHIPALAEQKKISSLIFKIDEQIYFQQKKLKYLQKSKRFLLQNMFI